MRITQNQIIRQYNSNSNKALTNMNDIQNRILSNKRFQKASEDPVAAAKASVVRENLRDCATYEANITTAEGIYSGAEKALLTISDVTVTITEAIIKGANGDKGPDENKIIAEEIRGMAEEMLATANSEYVDRKLFAGSNNSKTPFTIDETTGELTFNGMALTENDLSLYPKTQPVLVDIGLGMKFDENGVVDEQTAADLSINGAEVLGYGVDEDGDPKNIISLTMKAAEMIESGDKEGALKILDKINESKSSLLVNITKLGNKQKSLEYAKTRVANDEINLKKEQNALEGVDVAEESANLSVAKAVYDATLSMGSKIIPMSIWDYMK